MYHRVIDIKIDPWELAVSPDNFEQQIQILKNSGKVISLPCMIHQIISGKKFPPSIVITFDDGYSDNNVYAKPLLEEYNLPATFFISSKNIGTGKEFWWDELAHLILENPDLPQDFNLTINGLPFNFNLENEGIINRDIINKHRGWSAYEKPCTLRSQLYFELWKNLSNLNYSDQQNVLDELRNKVGKVVSINSRNYSMTEEQLIELAANNLFTMGAHTMSHPLLPNISKEFQSEEIIKNRKYLKSLLNQDIDYFAYPSGKYNEDSIEILIKENFKAAFSTQQKAVCSGMDCLQLGRFQVHNWSGPTFKKNISKWLGLTLANLE